MIERHADVNLLANVRLLTSLTNENGESCNCTHLDVPYDPLRVQNNKSALIIASNFGHEKIVELLIQSGAQADVQDEVSDSFHVNTWWRFFWFRRFLRCSTCLLDRLHGPYPCLPEGSSRSGSRVG